MKTRFNFDDPMYSISQMLLPVNARNLKPQSLGALFKRFPMLKEMCNMEKAETGWRIHASISPS